MSDDEKIPKVKAQDKNLKNSPIVKDKPGDADAAVGPFCFWNGQSYSTNAKICNEADHHVYMCTHTGDWWDTDKKC